MTRLALTAVLTMALLAACGGDDSSDKAEQNLRSALTVGEHTRIIAANCAERECRVKAGVRNPFYKRGDLEQLSDKNAECYQEAEDPMLDCMDTANRVEAARADRWLEVRTITATYNDDGKIVRVRRLLIDAVVVEGSGRHRPD